MYSRRKSKYFFKKKKHAKFYKRSISKPMFDPQRLLYYSTRTQREGQVIRPKTHALEVKQPMITRDQIQKYLDSLDETFQYKLTSRDKNKTMFGRMPIDISARIESEKFIDENYMGSGPFKINLSLWYNDFTNLNPTYKSIKKTPFPVTLENQKLQLQHVLPMDSPYKDAIWDYDINIYLVQKGYQNLDPADPKVILLFNTTYHADWSSPPFSAATQGLILSFNLNDIGFRVTTVQGIRKLQWYFPGIPCNYMTSTETVNNKVSVIYNQIEQISPQYIVDNTTILPAFILYLLDHSGINPVTGGDSTSELPFYFSRFSDLYENGFDEFQIILSIDVGCQDNEYSLVDDNSYMYIDYFGVLQSVNAHMTI